MKLVYNTVKQLHKPLISKRKEPVISHNNVIQDSHIQQDTTFLDLSGDLFIRLAGLSIATGMVVSQDDGGGMVSKADLENLFGVHDCAGDASFGDSDFFQDPVSPVQEQNPKLLIGEIAHQGVKDLKSVIAPANLVTQDHFGFIPAA